MIFLATFVTPYNQHYLIMQKIGWLFLFTLLATSCAPTWINGSWEGTGTQIDGNTWEVELLAKMSEGYEISYPDLSCGGVWDLTDASMLKIQFRENIEYGQENCDQGVEVRVKRLSRERIQVTYWIRSMYPDQPIAEAVLRKVQELPE